MSESVIRVVGAREHNLKNLSVDIPRLKLVVITGLSGSGKSSLAFDTLFAEGQRRYVESLSIYARQFLGQLKKPDVDLIEGLSPAMAIDQRALWANPRSTVGTVTEIYDYLRLLFARLGTPHCPVCGREVQSQSAQEIVTALADKPSGTRLVLLAPVVRGRKGGHEAAIQEMQHSGFVRMRVDGTMYNVEAELEIDPHRPHTIEAVVDRLVIPAPSVAAEEGSDFLTRLTDSVETALRLGDGHLIAQDLSQDPPHDLPFSEHLACSYDGTNLPEIEPSSFSFNSPRGACPACQGLGTRLEIDPDKVVPDRGLTPSEGAFSAMDLAFERRPNSASPREGESYWPLLEALAAHLGLDLDAPVSETKAPTLERILFGTGDEKIVVPFERRDGRAGSFEMVFEGVIPALQRRYQETSSASLRGRIEALMSERTCDSCGGRRLRPESLAVTLADHNIVDVSDWTLAHLHAWLSELEAWPGGGPFARRRTRIIAAPILHEIVARLDFLKQVGLDYLTLSRSSATLSGGEAQRIRMATQIGSRLSGVLYLLDEPSVGLHPRDTERLLASLRQMRDLGNTVLVVEHDLAMIRSSDWVIDLGPGAGPAGGHLVAEGPPDKLAKNPRSLTGRYLAGRLQTKVPSQRRLGNGKYLTVVGARANNLKNLTVQIPLAKLVCITGVSGSGKSTLLLDVLYRSLASPADGLSGVAACDRIEGAQEVKKVINIDQSPIGRTPRSNPATYVGLYGEIRDLFGALPGSKVRGYRPGRFSFNVRGGRCEACEGQGQIQVSMQFLPDVYVPCEVCNGARFNRETLQVLFKGMTIADILETTVEEARDTFNAFPSMVRKLNTLFDVGLGYIRLGQPAPTLSGGEAQRVKLARELSRKASGHTLYILDEPTVGLHAADVRRLISVLDKLVDEGHTVTVIEHNLDVIKVADHVIDLGPEGGDAGGEVIAQGTPEEVAASPSSHTGRYLRDLLFPQTSAPVRQPRVRARKTGPR